MSFYADKHNLIVNLENANPGHKDPALQRVVRIFRETENTRDLKKQKDLIDRIAIDGVENWEIVELILEFTRYHSK